MYPFISESDESVLLRVFAQPNAKKTEILCVHNKMLKIRVSSPPLAGKANKELLRFLSRLFKVSKSSISIVSGELNRSKVFKIKKITALKVFDTLLKLGLEHNES